MSLMDYIKGNKDFCQLVDFLDLVDLKYFNEKELVHLEEYKLNNKVINTSNIVNLSKYPIYLKSYDISKCLDNAIFYNVVNHSRKEDCFVLDKQTKHIVLDKVNLYYLYSKIHYLFNSKSEINFLKSIIDEYTILTIQDVKKEILSLIKHRQDELIKQNYDKLYNDGKNLINNEDDFIEKLENKIKSYFVLGVNIEDIKPNLSYMGRNNTRNKLNLDSNLNYFIVLYLRDKKEILNLIDTQFENFINEDSYDIKHQNEEFYMYEKMIEIYNDIKSDVEIDTDLIKFKTILSATKQAGKTITINDKKYDNHINKNCNVSKIEIGTYHSGYIQLKDIKTMKYGRKVLFDVEEFNRSL